MAEYAQPTLPYWLRASWEIVCGTATSRLPYRTDKLEQIVQSYTYREQCGRLPGTDLTSKNDNVVAYRVGNSICESENRFTLSEAKMM